MIEKSWDIHNTVKSKPSISKRHCNFYVKYTKHFQLTFFRLKAEEEAAITHEMEEEQFKSKVICIPPDDEMGFLLNLPPPCNVILQPSGIGLSGKVPDSPFMQAYQKFLRGKKKHRKISQVDD